MKKIQNISILLSMCFFITGCTGAGEYFEPRTYGVRNSIWSQMSVAEHQEIRQDYYVQEQIKIQHEMLAEQKRKNDILEKQLKQNSKDSFHKG